MQGKKKNKVFTCPFCTRQSKNTRKKQSKIEPLFQLKFKNIKT